MPDLTFTRRGMALAFLIGAGILLARRVGVHHYPPLAALGPFPSILLRPALPLVEVLMSRCRFLLDGPLTRCGSGLRRLA